MTMAGERADLLREELRRCLPGESIVTDPDVLASLSSDEAEWAPTGAAAAGVRARTEAEVQHVVRACAEHGAAVVPRGAGTGLSGGANATDGCVILDLSRMNQITEIDTDNLVAVVQPGVVNNDLKAAVNYSNEEARVEAIQRSLTPAQWAELQALHGDEIKDVRNDLDGVDQHVFDALSSEGDNYLDKLDKGHADKSGEGVATANALRLRRFT